ncbi:MAG: serine--tRNA ligase [Flavobacteriales bacterium]|nr:serine--tRNA ligase [Flavobacteriales bacterium]
MLQTAFIRENTSLVIERLKKRNIDATATVNSIIVLDDKRKKTQQELDALLAESNQLAKQIGDLFKNGKTDEANQLKDRTAEIKEQSAVLKEEQNTITNELQQLLYTLPNLPNELVPNGKSAEDNLNVYENNAIPKLPANALPHWELAKKYNLIDFELGVKISGAGFPVYKGKGAQLQRALITFFLDQAIAAGYDEIMPPLMVNEASGYGTGQLPDKEGQMYYMPADDLYMIPTAEVPITNIYRDVILKESDFPIKNVGYTPCFRREAGSYGKDVRGLNRLHQFDKVEIVQIQHPDKSYQTLDEMVEHVKGLLNQLELPYRILRLCGGDMGFTSALTYDMEVFSAAQEKWLEVSSISNFETFQANRLKCRYKDSEGKTQLVHTLNGSALALPRILASILENNQTETGIKIPKCLVPYTKFDFIS